MGPKRCNARWDWACVRTMTLARQNFAQHLIWRVLEPIGDEKGIVFVEIAIIEHQQKFTPVRIESLDRMWNSRREIPQVADTYIVDEISAFRVDCGDARRPIEHVSPFGSLVPMQLAHAASIQAHVHAGNVLGNAELAACHLAGP